MKVWRDLPQAHGPAGRRLCIVMTCTDAEEAGEVGRHVVELNAGCLITYRRAPDVVLNPPGGPVALVILAGDDRPEAIGRTLQWLRHRWPRCPVIVVGDRGCGEHELAARLGGASFFARPVTSQQWSAVLTRAVPPAVLDGSYEPRIDNRTLKQ